MTNSKKATFSAATDQHTFSLQEGLTKREYFAAMAMQGLLASHTEKSANGSMYEDKEIEGWVKDSVRFSDALLAELEKETINQP